MEERKFSDDHQALMHAGNWPAAVLLCRQAANAQVRTHSMLWNWAWAHFKLGEFIEAKRLLTEAVALEPDDAVTHWTLGVVLGELGEFQRAETHLNRALALRDSALGRLTLAVLYMRQGDNDAAERIHREGLRLAPNQRARVEAYADFLSDVGRPDDAAREYARAEALQPHARGEEKRRRRPDARR